MSLGTERQVHSYRNYLRREGIRRDKYGDSPMLAEDPVDEPDTIIERLLANEFISPNNVNSCNSTLPSVHTLLSLPLAKLKVRFRLIKRTITN
jgi:hypothetical protein